jgi:hypothetical protein
MGLVWTAKGFGIKPTTGMLAEHAHFGAAVYVTQLQAHSVVEPKYIRGSGRSAGEGKICFFQTEIVPDGSQDEQFGQGV